MKKYNFYKIVSVFLFGALIAVVSTRIVQTKPQKQIKHVQYRNRRAVPINIRTRGYEDYRQIGILSGNDGKVLPLYGRRTYNGSHKWNYFTQANDHLALKIPLSSKGRECDGNTGCDELYDNDSLHLPQYNSDFSIKLYDNSPRYIPY